MGFESFYGGRMGASFVIVKQFDGVDIPQVTGQEIYKVKYLATTNDGQYFIYDTDHFIIRDASNYKNYIWKLQALDGSTVDTKPDREGTGPISQQVLDNILAEGMVQCFTRGGESTDIVNYGEYVIIDTPDKSNPDNGKVYRRGMQFDSPTGGAEYIGQIVGPQGEAPELNFDHYQTVITEAEMHDWAYHEKEYDAINEDIIPGSYIDDNEERQFEDKIKYVYTTIRDEFGNITGCILGFKLPTLVQDFEASSLDPYDENYRRGTGTIEDPYYYTNLISEDPEQYIDNKWQHPFYQKWQIKIPEGIHGVNSTNIELVHTQTMPAGWKDNFEGALVYEDPSLQTPYMPDGEHQLVLTDSVPVLKEEEGIIYHDTDPMIYDANENVKWCKIEYNDLELFVHKSDCYIDEVRYRETDFQNLKTGEITYHYVGKFNVIQRITVANDGTLTVYYSASDTPQDIEKALTWIERVTLTQEGDFVVLYNNDKIYPNRMYETTLEWIDYITVDAEGTMRFYFNNNHEAPAFKYDHIIKSISNASIQTEIAEGADEGTGDQKIHIDFNTGESTIIGNPLNYIIETVICRPSDTYPNAPYSHLLVYYADPALRQTLSSKWVTYPSEKYPGKIWTEWVDLGDVRGVPGGLRIIEDVDDLNKLKDEEGNWIPPELLKDDSGVIINPEGAGWGVTYTPTGSTTSTIYCYNYNSDIWYSIGVINPGSGDPPSIIVKSAPMANTHLPDPTDVIQLRENGFWFASETAYFAD